MEIMKKRQVEVLKMKINQIKLTVEVLADKIKQKKSYQW
jgi:hypothetical protein